jgi:hypothetical protein
MAHSSKRALHLADPFTTTCCPDRTLFLARLLVAIYLATNRNPGDLLPI